MVQKKRGLRMAYMALLLTLGMVFSACTSTAPMSMAPSVSTPVGIPAQSLSEQKTNEPSVQTGWITEQILTGADGEIHYSYYLPEHYDKSKTYPMVVAMPGYDRMWFGEESAGKNLDWNGVQVWTKQDEEIIVVSAQLTDWGEKSARQSIQLTDWGEKSARQSIQLTEYMLKTFSVNPQRVYAAGYSAGGETMSQAVSMRPDLYAAYLHGASQWDGSYASMAEQGVAVYIYMAENDEYYGSQKARDAYNALQEAYRTAGWSDAQTDEMLRLEIPPDAYFNSLGIYNYHGGGNVLFDDKEIIKWMLNKQKTKSRLRQ